MLARSSAFKLAGFSAVGALCFWATPAHAQSAGIGGAPSTGGMAGAPSSGGMAGGLSTGGIGGAPSTGGIGGAANLGGAGSGGAPSGGGQGGMTALGGMTSSGAAGSSAGMSSSNLISNGTFDGTDSSPWWTYANNTADYPADITVAVTNGQLCGTMTAGGQNYWDVIIGISQLALLPNQYYRLAFSVSADADRTIRFKTGLGDVPYTDYFNPFNQPLKVTTTPQNVDYTYLNLRNDPTAQFQFQIGGTPGTVCVDNIIVEPVPAPATPAYTTPAPSGHPFKDYKGFLKMGTAVDTEIFLSNPLHNAIVAGEFSMITPANSMKMNLIQPTQGVFDYTDTDALVAWAKANNVEFRGHPLVWHTQTPSWLTDGMFDHDALLAIMYAQIDGLMGHYVGQFPYWDVVNEAVDNASGTWGYRSTVWHDTIGDDFMDLAFNHAHAADPNAKLFYNDYNDEQKGNPKADYIFDMVSSMKMRGIPIDGIGFQGHYYVEPDGTTTTGVPDMQAIRDNMARYNDIGLEVHITECDFRIGKPLDQTKTDLQNKFYADLLQACIDAPNCSHFTVWGLSDLDSWVPSTFPDYDFAHLFDKSLMPKPDYFAMSSVFAKYNLDGSMIGAPMGMAGAAGAMGMAGAAGSPPASHPKSSPKESSGGCSLASPTSGTAPWLLTGFSLLGVLLFRRRSKPARC